MREKLTCDWSPSANCHADSLTRPAPTVCHATSDFSLACRGRSGGGFSGASRRGAREKLLLQEMQRIRLETTLLTDFLMYHRRVPNGNDFKFLNSFLNYLSLQTLEPPHRMLVALTGARITGKLNCWVDTQENNDIQIS